ncbi:MAG: DNA polymerase [bacterium]|nr:DNA polymerase [bacterium]
MAKKEPEPKKLVLIDAHAILHRAYHALPEFSNSRGEPTGGLYGLAAMLIKIISTFHPDYIAAAYDLPKKTFRHEAYKDYKAGRPKADETLVSQMIRSREIFGVFGIPIYDKEGFEADDILGTIVEQVKGQRSKVKGGEAAIIIASGDMDTLQLVDNKRVQVFTLKKGINDTILYDEEAVNVRYGFPPELLPDFKGLKGDPSDNIKGIAGIGDKTATELIQKFGSIENIYKTLKKDRVTLLKAGIKERVVGLLEKGKEDAEFSKLLGTIRRDAPIAFSFPAKLWCESIDLPKAEALFTELEFRTLGERLKSAVGAIQNNTPLNSTSTTTPQSPPLKGGEAKQASFNDVLAATGISEEELAETAVALWLINSNLTNPTLDDILGFAQTRDWNKARETVFAEIQKRNLARVFEEIERPLLPVLKRMNERGVALDVAYLFSLSKEYHRELSKREKEIWKLAGAEFNINSPKQLGEVLFVKMGLKPLRQKKTAGGALSTRESELEKLREMHPIIKEILEYREFQKLLSTYIDTLPAMVGKDGRLHAQLLSSGSTTGRMASQNPNLQNIPIQTELGRRIRKTFVAEKGNVLLSLDYSQIELRVAAILSGDTKLISIFKRGEDVHTAVAAQVFDVPPEQVTKDMRRQAKVINFGMLYGMGVNSLRQALQEGGSAVSREEAQQYYDKYFSDFHELAAYLEKVKKDTAASGYTETLFGRRRYHEAIRSHIPFIRAAAERAAINAPLQGTAADLIKLVMVRVDGYFQKEKLGKEASLILQVHDELVFEVKEGQAGKIGKKIQEIMEGVLPEALSKGVPIEVEARVGKNWDEMKKLE